MPLTHIERSEGFAPHPGAEFPALGHHVRVTNARPDIERWLRSAWEVERSSSTTSSDTIDVAFCRDAPWRSVPANAGVELSALDGATLTWRRHGARWWSTGDCDAGLELVLLDDGARIRVWDRSTVGSMSLALHVAMCEALRARGLVPLHAAVIVRDGRATAIVGRSGVGKSTTLVSAIGAGWAPLAEDFAWLEPVTHRVCAWGGDRGVRLTVDGLARLPASWQRAEWRRDHDGKLVLGYEQLGVPRPWFADLTRVLVLARDPARDSALEPLPARDATRALWESAGVPLCRISRAAFAAQVPQLLSRVAWARLVLGRGPPAL